MFTFAITLAGFGIRAAALVAYTLVVGWAGYKWGATVETQATAKAKELAKSAEAAVSKHS